MADAAPVTGTVSGRFRPGALLGSGGTASVFRAEDLEAGDAARTVALKVLHPQLTADPHARSAFETEARIVRSIDSAGVVGVVASGTDGTGEVPVVWIAFDLAPGMTLSERVALGGPLAPAAALEVFGAVLSALEAIHTAGLVHRDVTPANIMVEERALLGWAVHLIDFGLADAPGGTVVADDPATGDAREPESTSSVRGSANYMSPEQALGLPVAEPADLYQAGAALYFALTGRPPFPRSSPAATLDAHIDAPPPVPSVVSMVAGGQAGIPRAVDRLVVTAMQKEPRGRYPSAAAMRDAIEAAREQFPGFAFPGADPPGSAEERTRRFAVPSAADPSSADVTSLYRRGRPAPRAAVPGEVPVSPPLRTSPLGSSPLRSPLRSPLVPARARRGIGAWVALLVVVAVVAIGWVLAAGATPGATVAEPSPPAAAASPSVTPSAIRTVPVVVPPSSFAVMPAVESQSLDAARTALAAAGLSVGAVTRQDSPSAADTVLAAATAAAAALPRGTAVDLIVATGSNSVPRVVGLSAGAAAAAITAAGLTPARSDRTETEHSAGTVLGSSPAEAIKLAVGSTVTVIVTVPPAGAPSPIPSGGSASPSPSPSASVRP